MGYSKKDLCASRDMLQVHFARLNKAIASNNYALCCAAVRAIQDECTNASRVAATLSLSDNLNNRR